ncbi:MAG TPA: hypothetical protein VFB22_01910 [Candidatus Baltobacteraceae bacterium]|nr:hypothetical protein [Candidatus Baltobacteraceae bacterium]
MRRVRFSVPNGDPEWDEWQKKVRRQREMLLKVFRAFRESGFRDKFSAPISDTTYKGSRNFIFAAFHRKCAYCESPLEPTVKFGDVEHFRPKAAVRAWKYESQQAPGDDPLTRILEPFTDLPGERHGGYFWLAYNIENLLPSCPQCNSYEKQNYFPAAGTRLTCDEQPECGVEEAMLVNPYVDDPNQHLAFDDEKGFVRPLSLKGAVSIAVYGLNRTGLPEARRREIMTAKLAFDDWYRALFDRDEATVAEKEAVLNEYETGVRPYSAAALTHIGALQEALLARGVAFSLCRGIWPSTLRSNIRVA